jgi:hypothetical protein
MPEDKLTWKPLENGRATLDQLQECAQTPVFFAGLIDSKFAMEMGPETNEKLMSERQTWTTIDECERVCKKNNKILFDVINNISNDDLEKKVEVPWGDSVTLADAIGFQYWNLVYHQGQINYIQTLYGDMQMSVA